ncbi:MAG TPA: Rpn family recombination-promoting nuclease/putative transposase [Candidatus Eisenbergiella merdipullorum]|uniref:Rpn family recombination-promoting nuclease/putative transposase n=1 Tax=Candidatus Eisenbergiella merdipullorum TaxID=2838553 RepID=A0A9D2I6A4_9FIRM|nr:Rpn family recombination-promoting nuclease/putative transposase [Candidatus Eisenbergiella merdipullorum]
MKEHIPKNRQKRDGRIAGQGTKKDSVTTLLFKTNNENFAELFNRMIPDGERILPEELRDEDIKETAYLRITKEGGGTSLVQYRDVVKSIGNGRVFAILGIENQSEIDYAMPFRVLELDFVNYARQIQVIRDRHEREWKNWSGQMHLPEGITAGEYLGRFLKEDRIIRCTTLVVYWGEQPWDGPKRLSDLFQGEAEAAHTVQLDLNLLDVCRMTEEEICRYTGELRTVFGFRKYAEDQEQLGRFIADNREYFNSVSGTAVNALTELTHFPQLQEMQTAKYQTTQGGYNMRNGLEGIIQDGIRKGLQESLQKSRQEGLQEGRQEGLQEGLQEGRQEGEMKKAKEMSRSLSAMGMSAETIASAAKVSVELVQEWLS